ncbi:asparaginase [Candidatus Woesearchaeota archaeon]|nr:asparaginase [Candidatus Woesearchaeota archaeon]
MAVEVIHFIMTGGTIDSYYEASKDTVVPHKSSIIPSFIGGLKLYTKSAFTEVCMKDSRNLTPKDLKNVLKVIEKSPHKKIIVAHGTYTMPDTARYLKANLKKNDKTIILTGSMFPITGFSPSDAPFNLGFAIAKMQDLEPDVYVCMNGKVFTSDKVTKIISEGRFASLLG